MTIVDKDQLLDSAQDFTQRALKAYVDNDTRVVLVFAAFALEHLSKAYLCGLHPALLMELQRGSVDSLLHLVNLGDLSKKASFPRTISAKDALKRVEHVLPSLAVPKERLHELIEVRDGVVHVGYLGSGSAREILVAFLRYAEAIHNEIGTRLEDRWGDHISLVDSLITETLDKVGLVVARKISIARARYQGALRGLNEHDDWLFHAGRKSASYRRSLDVDSPMSIIVHASCPACDNEGASCLGRYDDNPLDLNTDIPRFTQAYLRILATVERLTCAVCELVLENTDEVKAAGKEVFYDKWLPLSGERPRSLG